MPSHSVGALILTLVVAGCASTEMYTHDGYLTKYGADKTDAEYQVIKTQCDEYDVLESSRYACLRKSIPLWLRIDESYAELASLWLTSSYNVARGFEDSRISKNTAAESIEKIHEQYLFDKRVLNVQFEKVVSARNAREKQLARQRMGMALSKVGSDLMHQASQDKSISCMETVPGVIECDEW